MTNTMNITAEQVEKALELHAAAEQYANEERQRKEEVETRNHADTLVYSTEKTMKELGDKISEDDKAKINAEIENVKNALSGTDSARIKETTEKLTEVSYEVFGRIYQQANPNGAEGGFDPNAAGFDPNAGGFDPNSGSNGGDDGVVDADYEVVDK